MNYNKKIIGDNNIDNIAKKMKQCFNAFNVGSYDNGDNRMMMMMNTI